MKRGVVNRPTKEEDKDLKKLPQVLKQLKDVNQYDDALDTISNIAKKFKKNNITTSRLRNIYNHIYVLKDNEEGLKELKRVRYLLAYVAGRENKQFFREFVEKVDEIIKDIKNASEIELFKQFMEALIAYHRFHGGRE
jgi:CRISPR-associated protein Csm2